MKEQPSVPAEYSGNIVVMGRAGDSTPTMIEWTVDRTDYWVDRNYGAGPSWNGMESVASMRILSGSGSS